jgi:hypothetical protein
MYELRNQDMKLPAASNRNDEKLDPEHVMSWCDTTTATTPNYPCKIFFKTTGVRRSRGLNAKIIFKKGSRRITG